MRDTVCDIVKGIGIILVVACHANLAPFSPGRFFHMPLFFFVSGYLSTASFNKPLKEFLLSKIKSLYLPFVIVECVFLAFHNVFVNIGLEKHYYGITDFLSSALHIFLFDNFDMMLSPLWFMTALFFANILSYGFHKLGSRKWITLSLLLAFIGIIGVFPNPLSYNFKEGVNVILVAQFFCCLGYNIKNIEIKRIFSGRTAILFGVLAAGSLVLIKYYNLLSVDMRINVYDPLFVWLFAVVCGFYLVFLISNHLAKQSFLLCIFSYIGRNSLYIFLLHIFSFKLVCLMQVRLLGYDSILLPRWENVSNTIPWQVCYIIAGILLPLFVASTVRSIKRLSHKFL